MKQPRIEVKSAHGLVLLFLALIYLLEARKQLAQGNLEISHKLWWSSGICLTLSQTI